MSKSTFWNGRDMDDEFGKWVDLPDDVVDKDEYMHNTRKKHRLDCETDPEKKLFKRNGMAGFYYKYLPNTNVIDVEYYSKEWNKPIEEIKEIFKSEKYNVEAGLTDLQHAKGCHAGSYCLHDAQRCRVD